MTHAIKCPHLRIQTHLLLGNLGSMRDKELILLNPNSRAVGKRGKRIGKQLTAQLTKLHGQCLGMFTGNRGRYLRAISARIHAMPNAHNGNASNLVTSKNGTLNGSSATPTGQQRSMNIHNTERRHMQHLIGQNAAIGSHTENIGISSLKPINNIRRHTICLNNGQTKLKRLGLNRRRLQLFTTSANSIGTRNYQRNLIPSLNKRSKRRHREIGRTHKHNTHKERLPSNKTETAPNNSGKPSRQPIRNNNSTRTNIPKTKERAAIKAALPTKQLSAKTPPPGPTAPERKGARKRSPLPPQGLGYCSTRSSARAEEHLMCSSCEQDCLSMEQNLSPAAEGDGGTYSVSPGRAPRARASWYSLTALMRCIGLSRSNMVLPCR